MPSVAKCCPNCFGDRGLAKSIVPAMSSERGTCSYCESQDVLLVTPPQLADYFSVLISIYVQAEDGRQLIEWLREDWDLFHHPRMDNPRAKDLLAEVLDDGEIVRKTFVPAPKYQSDRLPRWEQLRTELMYENRYFPAVQFDAERLRELLDHLQADEVPTIWYRARLQIGDAPYAIGEMGAPPRRTAIHGRANPAGIPYLYLSSTPQTAVSEVRPHTGENACVADFSVAPSLKLVDLRNPRRIVSPFVLTDEDEIGMLRSDIGFLERLGAELTRPIVLQAAPIDYVPSQYLCEFIKKCGYAGVIYRSSVSDGINLALFNPAQAIPGTVAQYTIERVAVDVRKI
jgi:hypothetical protein